VATLAQRPKAVTPPKALLIPLLALLAAPSLRAAEQRPSERLASQLSRAAAALIETGTVSVRALDGSMLLATEAARLAPTPDRWRTVLQLADLTEREDLQSEALAVLIKAAPDDEVVRLRYITAAVEQRQTVEERIAFYRKLLAPEYRQRWGPAVTSRLCADLAFLLDRAGDVDGFSEWLAEAVAVDPSNRAAAATAAGFFRANATDPYGEAELLLALVMADPTAPEALVSLAELLLEHGAYAGADRLYRVAVRSREVLQQPVGAGLLADWAVAQWGHGEWEAALKTIQQRQRRIDEVYRLKLRQQDPKLTVIELARLHKPVTTTLSTVRAAIHNRLNDDDAASMAATAVQTYALAIAEVETAGETSPPELAESHLEAAFVALWLAGDVEAAENHLEAADALLGEAGLSPAAEARFEGWIALRQGDLTKAQDRLISVSDDDPAARLGLAVVRREQGALRDAARDLYAVYQNRPGTAMGVWAGDVLAELVGRRVPPNDLAPRLEALVETIPSIVDRFPDDPTQAVSMRLLPAKTTFGPYEPVIINLEITNNAPMPLAIDDGGPIQVQVALLPSVQMSREFGLSDVRPMIVDIGRRLRLRSWERLVVPVDLRRGPMAQMLLAYPLRGATISIRGILGLRMTYENVFEPGAMGSEVETPSFRVDGVRVTTAWIEESLESALDPQPRRDLVTIALLSHVVPLMKQVRKEDPLRALEQFGSKELENAATAAIIEAYGKLDSMSRAWLLAVMPRRSPPLAPVYAMAQKDDDKYVRMVYLLFCVDGPDDPMIDAAIRGDDPEVRQIAELMRYRLQRSEDAQ
jgi:tetratricopeptide (TPR) repeat protein